MMPFKNFKNWIRTGKQAAKEINSLVESASNGKIKVKGLDEIIEGVAQDRAVTILVKHLKIDSRQANELYEKYFNEEGKEI